jgi:hypothetical protein
MENRSFDHMLGWLPHSNGRQKGLTYLDKSGHPHPTYHLRDYQNCAMSDPDHSYVGGRIQYDGGKCDGWLRAATNDLFPIGYYEARDLSFLSHAAPGWSVCDNYFASLLDKPSAFAPALRDAFLSSSTLHATATVVGQKVEDASKYSWPRQSWLTISCASPPYSKAKRKNQPSLLAKPKWPIIWGGLLLVVPAASAGIDHHGDHCMEYTGS